MTVEDKAEIAIDAVTVRRPRTVTLSGLSPALKRGQTVTVTYADPGTGDDMAGAVQDDARQPRGELRRPYAVTPTGRPPAATVPAKPMDLGAEARGPDRIDLSWNPPSDTGGREVTGYRIEFSSDGVNFGALVERHATMRDDRLVTAYAHDRDRHRRDAALPGLRDQRRRHAARRRTARAPRPRRACRARRRVSKR